MGKNEGFNCQVILFAGFPQKSKIFRQPPTIGVIEKCQISFASVKFSVHSAGVLTEVYEHLAVTLPHVLRHGEDAGHIIVQE